MDPKRVLLAVAGAALLAASLPTITEAQEGHEGFLLKQPRASLGFHLGYAVAGASSEIFDFTRERLTVGDRAFDAPSVGGSLGIRVNPRWDVRLDLSYSRSEVSSEFRDWVDLDDLPIEQETSFQRVPVTVGIQYYLKDRGRSVGRFAWVPSDWNAYVGVGGGATFYRFEQVGDFVDFETLDIFADRFTDEGSALTGQAFAGAEVSLSPTFLLTAEGRYNLADPAEMSGDFLGFEPMDLSGFEFVVGLSARF